MKPLLTLNTCILVLFVCISCEKKPDSIENQALNYREEMRLFVQKTSAYAKKIKSEFVVIPQNGQELLTTGDANAPLASDYIRSIDAIGREDLVYGYDEDNMLTPLSVRNEMNAFLQRSLNAGKYIFVTDYCSTPAFIDESYRFNNSQGYISFAADRRELDHIPAQQVKNENAENITSLKNVKNFLYLINPGSFSSKEELIQALSRTNYDLIILDLFYNEEELTQTDLNAIKKKLNGGSRLVICYMSIGEAEDYRYYWNSDWNIKKPSWLDVENPEWKGNYKVRYWNSEWQQIIYGNDHSYVKKIIDAGFDGVYLDIIDAFEYFE